MSPPPSRRAEVSRRAWRWVPAVLLGVGVPVLAAAPAAAVNGDYVDPHPLSRTVLLLIFVGIPVLTIAVVAARTLRSGRGSGGALSYRPGRPWTHEREWFGTEPPERTASPRVSVPGLGGASARW